ncbi:MAG: hypothetical protein H6733_03490 [Alphaproteobacteria bacterium]|nr:hypothetical protein [Alphaproteobacteria bacterium]
MSDARDDRWLRWASWAVWPVLLAIVAPTQRQLFVDHVLQSNENTWRDFTVYAEVARGFLPLEGPPTSVGGHHGYLGAWLFGAWSALVPGDTALRVFDLGIWAVSTLAAWALARQVASAPAARLAAAAYLASNFAVMTAFPNHIAWMPLGAALAMLGLLRSGEGARWALLCVAGVVLEVGVHRSGWLLLVAVLAIQVWQRRGLFAHPWVWTPLALYLVPTITAWSLGEEAGHTVDGMRDAVGHMDPLLALRTMPFWHFAEPPPSGVQWAQAWTVVAALALAWRSGPGRDARAVLALYTVSFVALLFYKYDTHYYLPMFALLPAVLALAIDAAHTRGVGALWVAVVVGIEVAGAAYTAQTTAALQAMPGSPLHPTRDELIAVQVLDDLGVGEDEVLARTWDSLEPLQRPLHHLWVLFASDPWRPGHDDRCLRVEPGSAPVAPGTTASHLAGELRVDVSPRPEGGCPSNVARRSPPIWYLDLSTGGFVRR